MDHSERECLLMVQREVSGVILPVVENYRISVRIYCEQTQDFNYVCRLTRLRYFQDCEATMLKVDCESLEQKGASVYYKHQRTCEQLSEKMELCDI